jgi:hypothetical protein
LTADSSDQIVGRQASAGSNGGIVDFICLAGSSADTVGGVVDLQGRAHSTRVSDKVVTLSALASSVDILFIRVAGSGAETKVEKISIIANALLGLSVIGGMSRTYTASSIGQLIVLGKADATLIC